MLGSAIAAYVALSRLTYSLTSRKMLTSIIIVTIFFISFNLIASITGEYCLVYQYTTEASLVTLFSSHAIVSAVYPLFVRKFYKLNLPSVLLGLSSTTLMAYGLYSNLIPYEYPNTLIGIVSLISGVILGIVSNILKPILYRKN
ncbi:MAG: hypothetical protein RRE78_01810 [Acidianus sp.]|nr:hypothetical protein [Acidianus sp.]